MSLWLELARTVTSSRRLERIEAVLEKRTDYVLPVFENLHKPHNASAVLRSCDALGIGYAAFIDSAANTPAELNRDISKGAHKWIHLESYRDRESCLQALRGEGYTIAATCFSESAYSPETLPLDQKIAVVFGNEREGISDEILAESDYQLMIPMHGFVDSFNISVAAAIVFYVLMQRLRAKPEKRWQLPPARKKRMLRRWLFYNTRLGSFISRRSWRKRIVKQKQRDEGRGK